MKENKLYKNKMGMFDLIKGIAIFGVVFQHTVGIWYGEAEFEVLIMMTMFVGICWMPVFLLSSAYWYKPKPIKSYTKSKIRDMIVPFICMEVVLWISYSMIHYAKWGYFHDTLKGVRGVVLGAILGSAEEFYIGDIYIVNVGPMWFVLTLCFAGIIFNMIMNQTIVKFKFGLVVMITLFGIMFAGVPQQIYCFSATFAAVLGYYVGYKLKETNFLIKKWTKKDYGILGLMLFVFIFLLLRNDNFLYSKAAVVSVFIPMGILALRLGLKLGQCKDNFITLFFKRLGRYTFWILMVHTVEMISIDWRWFKEWHMLAVLPPYMNFLIVLLIRCCLIAFGCFLVAKGIKVWMRIRENVISKRIVRVEK